MIINKIKEFLFQNKTPGQMAAKNTAWLAIGEMVSRLIRAGLIIYAARVLGTEGYGVFSYALSLAALFTVFSDIGLSPLLTREIVKQPEKIKEYFSTSFILKLILLLATVLITLTIAPFFIKIEAARSLIPIIVILIAFDSLRDFGFSLTRAENRMETEAGLKIATNIAITALGVIVLTIRPETRNLAIAYAAGSGIGLVLVIGKLWNQFKNALTYFKKELIKPILTAAWPFAIMGLLGGFMINIDTVILGWFKPSHELGLYAAAYRPVLLLYVIPGFLSISLFPIMSRFVQKNKAEEMKKILQKSLALVLGVALPIALGGLIVAKPFITLLFGSEYSAASLAFQILTFALLFVFPGTIIGNAIFAYDRQRIFIFSTAGGAILNIVLDILLIPPYSIAGSAVATLISQIFINGYNWYQLKKIISFTVLNNLGRFFISTLAMAVVVILLTVLNMPVIITVIIGALVFMGSLIILKEPLLSEVRGLIWR
jgi:O-antigen/teichoic acid export membrane protein